MHPWRLSSLLRTVARSTYDILWYNLRYHFFPCRPSELCACGWDGTGSTVSGETGHTSYMCMVSVGVFVVVSLRMYVLKGLINYSTNQKNQKNRSSKQLLSDDRSPTMPRRLAIHLCLSHPARVSPSHPPPSSAPRAGTACDWSAPIGPVRSVCCDWSAGWPALLGPLRSDRRDDWSSVIGPVSSVHVIGPLIGSPLCVGYSTLAIVGSGEVAARAM